MSVIMVMKFLSVWLNALVIIVFFLAFQGVSILPIILLL